jgi:2-(1,2-epoxy-1,2-dihydrophenyl)acetyl-CoA isomerase
MVSFQIFARMRVMQRSQNVTSAKFLHLWVRNFYVSDLLESRDGAVVTVTFNRPDSLNALTNGMLADLRIIAERTDADPTVGAVVLTGAGRAFCSGGDVKSMAEGSEASKGFDERARSLRRNMEVSRVIHECSKPWIAAVRGPAAGAGLSVALACDMRVASETARFITAFAKVGLSGDFGGSYFLSQLIGTGRARELYYTGGEIRAEEALRLGVANRVVPDDKLEEEAAAFAAQLAAGPRLTIAYMKKNMNVAERGDLSAALDAEAIHHSRTGQTEDHAEAAKAFAEKRKPVFKGR